MATPNPAAGLLCGPQIAQKSTLAADSPPFPGVVNDPRQKNFPTLAAVDLDTTDSPQPTVADGEGFLCAKSTA